jgi:hypothetical protein
MADRRPQHSGSGRESRPIRETVLDGGVLDENLRTRLQAGADALAKAIDYTVLYLERTYGIYAYP